MRIRLLSAIGNIVIATTITSPAWAQSVSSLFSLPGATQPSQVGRALKSEQPRQAPQVLPPIETEKPSEAKGLPAEAQKLNFQLNQVILKGNHIYSTKQLEPIYQKKLHSNITVAELFEIVQNITNFYRNNGYILSRAILPPQHVKGGIVEIQIIEGYIGAVSVSGKPKGAKCMVQQFGDKIKECRPLQITRLEKYMLLANEIPGTSVKAVLAPSESQTGAADLALVTENQAMNGYMSYDNYGTRYIGPQQMTFNLKANSFLLSGDTGQATFTKTPKGSELTYTDVNYNAPVNAEGWRWLAGGTRVQTHPLFVLQPANIDGVNVNYYTNLYIPSIRNRSQNLTYRIGFNYVDSEVTFSPFNLPLYTDNLRSLDLGGTFNFADRWRGSNLISADFRQGLPIWGYSSNNDVNTATTSRPGGRGAYTKIMLTLSRVQVVHGPWSLYGIAQGQWAFNPLLAEEQFTFGGPVLGRGYDVAELIGDKGASGSVEIRYDKPLPKLWIQNAQFYVYYDAGAVWNYLFVGGTPIKQSGTTTGIGVRFAMNKYVSGNFMWTQVLTRQIAAEELIGDGKRPRVFFSLVASI